VGTTTELITFPPVVVEAMQAELPAVAEHTVATIVVEVPSYADAFAGEMGRAISSAVQLALGGFFDLATATGGVDPSLPIGPALEGAYKLGRGEARSGRSMDALLAAYRVGARVAWRHMSDTAVAAGLTVGSLARFAELVFAYIDQLSAASVAGHTDELETTGRVRRHHLERLGALLLAGRPEHDLTAAGKAPLDTEQRLSDLVLRADDEALRDLRSAVLAPLDAVSPGVREKLTATLRSWLLHHGRREQIAAELFVHPQTVRYRMGQLRDLFGDRLEDPQTVLALTIALGARAD
jgi:hypothetical protein